MRKAFNFFHSYFDVANELNDKDRLAFYDALLHKQFNNIEPSLNGMAKFAYLSQKHSIEAQIKGYFDKTKDEKFNPLATPWQGGSQGGLADPSVQEKEKEQEKEQDVYIHPLNLYIKSDLNNVSKLKTQLSNEECERLILEFNKTAIREILEAMENKSDLTKRYKSVNLTLRSWIKQRREKNPTFGEIKKEESKLLFDNYYGLPS